MILTFVPNPVWNDLTDHNMVNGHPLGGYPMAERAGAQVADHKGQVFTGSGSAVHSGLYVMGGSVIRRSLGANPLLKISALYCVAAWGEEWTCYSSECSACLPLP